MSGPSYPIAAVFLLLSGCVSPPALPPATAPGCLLPGEQRMIVAELFFGLAIHGRGPLSKAEWADFAAQTITPNFPDGFTVFDGEGQWRNPRTRAIARERTKVLLIAAKPDPDLARRLLAVIGAYQRQFPQQSVGVITREACAAF